MNQTRESRPDQAIRAATHSLTGDTPSIPASPTEPMPAAPVVVVHVRPERGRADLLRTVTVKCPHCGRKHIHGWPWDAEPGVRVPHCHRDRHTAPLTPYTLTGAATAPVKLLDVNGRVIK